MLCQFLLSNNENQQCVYIYPFPREPPSHQHHCTLQVITEHQAELPVLYSRSSLVTCFTHGSVQMSMQLSQLVPTLCAHKSILCVLLFLSCKQVHQYHFFQTPYILLLLPKETNNVAKGFFRFREYLELTSESVSLQGIGESQVYFFNSSQESIKNYIIIEISSLW